MWRSRHVSVFLARHMSDVGRIVDSREVFGVTVNKSENETLQRFQCFYEGVTCDPLWYPTHPTVTHIL